MTNTKSFKTVENYEQILENAKVFNKWLESDDPRLVRKLSNFRQWYYVSELDDFAPSKFIGYKDMNPDDYLIHYNKTLDGRETEPELKKYFQSIERDTYEWTDLMNKLVLKLGSHDKAPNKGVSISR